MNDLASSPSPAINATEAGARPFVTLKQVRKTFEGRQGTVTAVESMDLDIGRGEFVSVIGPSGCGKSTMMMMVAGLTEPTSGRIEIDGKPVTGPFDELGIVFQQDALLEWRSALDNIVLQAEIRRTDRNKARSDALELLRMVGLDSFTDALPHELSGGMRQRVSICRALLHRPSLLVMDEPFGALDALTRDQLQIDLLRLRANRNMTILFITHSIAEAVFLSDRIIVMSPRPGRIEAEIKVDLPRPRRLAVRESKEYLGYMHQVTEVFESLGVLQEDH